MCLAVGMGAGGRGELIGPLGRQISLIKLDDKALVDLYHQNGLKWASQSSEQG